MLCWKLLFISLRNVQFPRPTSRGSRAPPGCSSPDGQHKSRAPEYLDQEAFKGGSLG